MTGGAKKGGGGQPHVYEHKCVSQGRLRLAREARRAKPDGSASLDGRLDARTSTSRRSRRADDRSRCRRRRPPTPPRFACRRSIPCCCRTKKRASARRRTRLARAVDAPPADSAKVSEARDDLRRHRATFTRVDDAAVACTSAPADRDLGAAFQFLGNLELKRFPQVEVLLCFEEELLLLHIRGPFQPRRGRSIEQRPAASDTARSLPPPHERTGERRHLCVTMCRPPDPAPAPGVSDPMVSLARSRGPYPAPSAARPFGLDGNAAAAGRRMGTCARSRIRADATG